MQPFVMIKFEIGFEPRIGLLYVLKVTEVHLFILHRPPQLFNKDVVKDSTSTIHANLHVLCQQDIGQAWGRELTALITIANLTLGVLQKLRQGVDTKRGFSGWTEGPLQDIATMPIDDGHEIHKTVAQPNVRDIRTPDLIAASHPHPSQEIRTHLVVWMAHAGLGFGYTASSPICRSNRRTRFSLTGWPHWRKYSVIVPTP